MKCTLLALLCVSTFANVPRSLAQTVVTGSISGAHGEIVQQGSAHIVSNATSFPRPILDSFPANESGRFEAQLERGGVYRFWFTGRFHDRFEFPIYIETGDSVDVNVVLGALPYPSSGDSLLVYLGITKDEKTSSSRTTVYSQNHDGLFDIDFPSDADSVEIALRLTQLSVPTSGHAGNADTWTLNRDGLVESIFLPKSTGVARTTVNINTLNHQKTYPRYELTHAPSRTLTFSQITSDFDARELKAREYLADALGTDKRHYEAEYDWEDDLKELDRQLKREKDPFAKQVRYVVRMRAGISSDWLDYKLERKFAREVLDAIEPTSSLWSYFPALFGLTMRYANPVNTRLGDSAKDYIEIQTESAEYEGYIYSISHDQGDESSRQTFLANAVGWAFSNKQFEQFEAYYQEYMAEFGDTRGAERVREAYRPNKAISVGKMIPDFAVADLDDPDKTITRASLYGTTYLMNFWATWCGPCITKMEPLHKIQAAYEDQDFTVFGVSINFNRKEAHEFRKRTEWKMPWLNAHVDDWEAKTGVLKDLEVVAIPKSILVGPDGMILAIDTGTDAFYDDLIELMRTKN